MEAGGIAVLNQFGVVSVFKASSPVQQHREQDIYPDRVVLARYQSIRVYPSMSILMIIDGPGRTFNVQRQLSDLKADLSVTRANAMITPGLFPARGVEPSNFRNESSSSPPLGCGFGFC